MKLLLVTTHNLATNPRILKEIHLALDNGYEVNVLCFDYANWSKSINDSLLNSLKNKATVTVIPSGRKPLLPWLFSSSVNLTANILLHFFPNSRWLLSAHSNKRSILLTWYLKKIRTKFDLVIGHTTGTFYPLYIFSKKNKIPFGIDLEDYHAGETSNEAYSKRIKKLSEKTLQSASYLTAASPLILEYSLDDIGMATRKAAVVNNTFSSSEFFCPQPSTNNKLRLVWFSQNIDKGRGLEQVIPVVTQLSDKVELHLYGNLNDDFYNQYLKHAKNILIHKPLPQKDLHHKLSYYDIGLAIEPNKDLNNSLALSNKINAYLQAGLYIIASDTPAQRKWMNEMKIFGEIVSLDEENLFRLFNNCLKRISLIRVSAQERFLNAREYCWEKESDKLLNLWKNIHCSDTSPVLIHDL